MRIFLSYSSADEALAERIDLALRGAGHEVFFGPASLPPGETFDLRIIEAIDRSDLFVFLVSPAAVAEGSYTLTELGIARRRWPQPARRVLPVMVRPVAIPDLPPYLRAVTVLEPEGETVSEVVATVDAMANRAGRRVRRALVRGVPILGLLGVGAAALLHERSSQCGLAVTNARMVVGALRAFPGPAGKQEEALRLKQHDDTLSGAEHAAASGEWSDLTRANNQRLEDLLADARRTRDDLMARCGVSADVTARDWNMPGPTIYAPRLWRALEAADALDTLASRAEAKRD